MHECPYISPACYDKFSLAEKYREEMNRKRRRKESALTTYLALVGEIESGMWCRSVVLTFQQTSESIGGLVKQRFLGPIQEFLIQ